MRALLWISVLLATFVLAWMIQDRWAAERREERDAAYARPSDGGSDLPEGFTRVVVGEPSGAAPVVPPTPPVPRPGTASPRDTGGAAANDRLRHHVVKPGDSLSKICAAFYGTARKDVVDAVARANGLSKPEALRAGQQLVLPPLQELKGPPR